MVDGKTTYLLMLTIIKLLNRWFSPSTERKFCVVFERLKIVVVSVPKGVLSKFRAISCSSHDLSPHVMAGIDSN